MVHLELDTLVREAVDAFRAEEVVEVKAPTPPPPASAPSSSSAQAGAAATGSAGSALETEKSQAGQQQAAGDQSSATARSQLSQPATLAADGEGSALSPSASRNANRLTAPAGEELAASTGRPASSLNASELRGGGLTPIAPPDGLSLYSRPLIDFSFNFTFYFYISACFGRRTSGCSA